MEFDRNKIKETFLHELQFGIGHPKCDFCEEKMDNIEDRTPALSFRTI